MALTTAQLADALRLDAADAKVAGQLQRIQPAAEAAVLRFAPQAPEAIRDEATIRLAGYLYDAPTVPQPGIALTTAPLRASGAAGLLAPYRRHRLGITGAATGDAGAGQPSAAPTIDEDAVNALIAEALAPYATTAALNAAIAGIMPAEGGTGLTTAQAASLARLMVFEVGMKRATVLAAQARLTQAVSGASASIPGNPILPPNRFDREILVTVGTFQGRFYIKDLENLGGVSTIGAQLTGANSIEFSDTVAAAKYFVSYHTTDRAILFASDTTDDYVITLSDYDIDLEDFARRSSAERLPRAKAPVGSLDITHLERLISITNEGTAANDQVLFYDASAAPGTDQIREISFAQLDRRWLLISAANDRIDGRIAPWARHGQSAPSGGAASFTALTDTPSALGTAGQHVAVNAGANALEFVNAPSGGDGGATTFAGLTGRIAETQLPKDLDDLLDALDEGGWKAWPAAAVSNPRVSKATRASINTQQAGPYNAKYSNPSGTAQPNAWMVVRVANADVANVPTARIGARDSTGELVNAVAGKDWELIEDTTITGFTFYNVQITPQIPGDNDVEIERYNEFSIDTTKVRTLPAGGAAGQYVDFTGAWKDLPRPQRGLRILQDGNLAGLALTNLNSDVRYSALSLLNPVFDFDTAGNGNGEFHAELTLTVTNPSSAVIAFTSNATGGAPSRTSTGLAFATTVAAAAAYASTSSPGGVMLAQANLYAGRTVVGTVILTLGRNAQNQVGLFLEYDGAGGTAVGNCSIAAHLELSFTPSDSAAGAGPAAFTGLTDTPGEYTGQGGRFVAVNAAANALAFVAAPGGATVSFVAGSATATRRLQASGLFGNRIPFRTGARTLYNWLTGTRDARDFIVLYWRQTTSVTGGPGYPIVLRPWANFGAGAITMRNNGQDIRFWMSISSSQYYVQTTTIAGGNISGGYFGVATVSH